MRLLVAGIATAFSVWAPNAVAQCARPGELITLEFADVRTAPDWFTGTWTATGAIHDAGTTSTEISLHAPGAPAPDPKVLPERAELTHVFTSPVGSLRLNAHASLAFPNADDFGHTAVGPFTLTGGGRYEGLAGEGTLNARVVVTSTPGGGNRKRFEFTGSYEARVTRAPRSCPPPSGVNGK
jgi:hypothetical protein